MIAYFDSSAIVKLLVPEPGSDVGAEVWNTAEQRVAGSIAYPEVKAALAAAHRLGRVSKRAIGVASLELDELWGQTASIVIDDGIAHLAGELAQSQALRGFDAVHLACALAADDDECVMVTWDRDLHEASTQCGLPVAPAHIGDAQPSDRRSPSGGISAPTRPDDRLCRTLSSPGQRPAEEHTFLRISLEILRKDVIALQGVDEGVDLRRHVGVREVA